MTRDPVLEGKSKKAVVKAKRHPATKPKAKMVRMASPDPVLGRPKYIFWDLANKHDTINESDRLQKIHSGYPANLYQELRKQFSVPDKTLETLLNASISTLERLVRKKEPLDTVASERIDRLASVTHLAVEVFEEREAASTWLSTPNKALGDVSPLVLCETELGAKQVRRVLHALEWGGVV